MKTAASSFTAADIEEMVATRRDLHAHPELAFEEHRTSGVVAEKLKALGLEPRTGVGKTGVVATLAGARGGRTVLLRADMDALPIQEENGVPYRSQTAGKMHACGHDCHTSILLGVARRLVRERDALSGGVTLCFQPAEEVGGGAEAMIRDGALESPKPDAAFGVHVWQDLDLGKIGVTAGPMMAAVDDFTVTVSGPKRRRSCGSLKQGTTRRRGLPATTSTSSQRGILVRPGYPRKLTWTSWAGGSCQRKLTR